MALTKQDIDQINAIVTAAITAAMSAKPSEPQPQPKAAVAKPKASLKVLPTPTKVGQKGHGVPKGSKATSNHDYVVKAAKSGNLYWAFVA